MDAKLSHYWTSLQQSLFPDLENRLGTMSTKHYEVIITLDFLDIDKTVDTTIGEKLKGRKKRERDALARAFIAKAVLNLQTTKALIDRLTVDKVLWRICGFNPLKKLPCEATFSNAFKEFSNLFLAEKLHEILISETYKNTLDGKLVGHISRDSTDIPARIKIKKTPKDQKGKRKTPKLKGKNRRLYKQQSMSLKQMLDDLPKKADGSIKRGYRWKGYKFHLDVADGGIPISGMLTSASVHDSQVAIPLEEISSKRVLSFYSLMDSAYDAKEIIDFVTSKGKIPIIDPLQRKQDKYRELCPAQQHRYRERTTVERVFARLKDDFGVRYCRVKEHEKVFSHIMFGVLAYTAQQLIRTY
jgi:hypothetical protein